jgi:hypothetical protein
VRAHPYWDAWLAVGVFPFDDSTGAEATGGQVYSLCFKKVYRCLSAEGNEVDQSKKIGPLNPTWRNPAGKNEVVARKLN